MAFSIIKQDVFDGTALTTNRFQRYGSRATRVTWVQGGANEIDDHAALHLWVETNLAGNFPGTNLPNYFTTTTTLDGNQYRVIQFYRESPWGPPPPSEEESFIPDGYRSVRVYNKSTTAGNDDDSYTNYLPQGDQNAQNVNDPMNLPHGSFMLVPLFRYIAKAVLDHNPLVTTQPITGLSSNDSSGTIVTLIGKRNSDAFAGPLTTFAAGTLVFLAPEIHGFLVNGAQELYTVEYHFAFSPLAWKLQEIYWDGTTDFQWKVNENAQENDSAAFSGVFEF